MRKVFAKTSAVVAAVAALCIALLLIFAPPSQYYTLLALSAVLLVAASSVIAVYLATRKSARALCELEKAAKQYASGKFDVRIDEAQAEALASAARALNEMAASLDALESRRNSFLADVSHDLRTPLTTVGGFVGGILDGTIPPEKHEHYLGIIAQEVARLTRLVNALLDIGCLEAGRAGLNIREFSLSETARRALISCESRIEAKKLDITFESSRELYALGDVDAVHKVIYNLLDNAVKFSPEGGSIVITLAEKPTGRASLTVKGGCPIPPEELPFLFERFYKSDRSRGKDRTGTGLGLYICKATADALGGEITASSSQDGTVFEFLLPLSEKR